MPIWVNGSKDGKEKDKVTQTNVQARECGAAL